MTIAARHAEAAIVLLEPGMLIAGDWVTKTNAGTMDRIDPSTNELLSSFPVAGAGAKPVRGHAACSTMP
jgi:aldehyde dehydrogenase (NAD+)